MREKEEVIKKKGMLKRDDVVSRQDVDRCGKHRIQ